MNPRDFIHDCKKEDWHWDYTFPLEYQHSPDDHKWKLWFRNRESREEFARLFRDIGCTVHI